MTLLLHGNVRYRRRQLELMEQPGLDVSSHRRALEGISRINSISGSRRVIGDSIDQVVAGRRLAQVRLLDLGCGGGDLAIWLARRGQRRGLDFLIDGYDISQTAVAHARAAAAAARVRNVRFQQRDALGSLPPDRYDIVMCALLLHHLDETAALALLRNMAAAARHAVLVDDLQRTPLGYWLAWLGCRVFTRSPVVRVDGPLSVERAFTAAEVRDLARKAGLGGAAVAAHWPQRYLLRWSKP